MWRCFGFKTSFILTVIQMKFGPGKTNQFVLIETRRDFLMWNMQDESIFSKMPKENVLAIDWISSDRMVFLEQEHGYSDFDRYRI